MNISKGKIDQIFQEKLEDHMVKPRPAAWDKLELKLAQNKKKVLPIWQRLSIAASIALILISGIITYNYWQKSEIPKGQLAIETTKPNQVAIKTSEKVFTKPAKRVLSEKGGIKNELATSNFKINKLNETLEFDNKIILNENETKLANIKPIELNKLNVENEIDQVITQNADLSVETIPEKEIKDEALTVVFTLANFEKPIQNTTMIENTEKEKKGYLSRFFKQLINAKNGEKVEWNEIGFKPSKLFARAENKLKNSQNEVTSSYQSIKEKTVL